MTSLCLCNVAKSFLFFALNQKIDLILKENVDWSMKKNWYSPKSALPQIFPFELSSVQRKINS
jgi:hypothetical protein